MLQERIKNLPVNWFDGMSINKAHFIAQENYFSELLMDTSGQRISKNNYGILPDIKDTQSIRIDIDSHQILRVNIRNLRAVTLCGARIEITEDTVPLLQINSKMSDYLMENPKDTSIQLSVILTIDPFARNPFGNADPEEVPPRKPHVLPEYNINLIPTRELENIEIGLYHLSLGQISISGNECVVNKTYIPPCTSIESHLSLIEAFHKTENHFIELELCAIKIIQKVRGKNQRNSLAITLCDIAEKMLHCISSQLPAFKLDLIHQQPINLIEKIIVLARITHNAIDTWQGNGKEEILTYFTEWCSLNQGMFDKTLTDLAELSYKHHDIQASIQKTENFLQIILPLFKALSELDYIGKNIDTHLFVTEESANSEAKSNETIANRNWFKKL